MKELLKRQDVDMEIGIGEAKVKIFNPNPEKQAEILKLLSQNVNTDGKLMLNNNTLIAELVEIYTDIPMKDFDNETITEILNDPSEMFEEVVGIIKKKLQKLITKIEDRVSDMPLELIQELEKQVVELEQKVTTEEKQKEIEELEKLLEEKRKSIKD